MAKIKIVFEGVYAYVDGDLPKSINEWLEAKYTYVDPEDLTEQTPLYTDGWMLHGLADSVAKDLQKKGYLVQVEQGEFPKRRYDWRFKGKARQNQGPALKSLWENPRGAMEATMGSGKSSMIAATAAHFGAKTLVVAFNNKPYKSLVRDALNLTNLPVCVYKGDEKQLGPVVYAMLPSLLAAIKRKDRELLTWLKTVEVLLIDEAHHCGAKGTAKLFMKLRDVKVIYGYTGTYRRADDRGLILKALIGSKRSKAEITYAQQINTEDSVPATLEVEYIKPKETYVASARYKRYSDRNAVYALIKDITEDYIVNGSTGFNDAVAEWTKAKIAKGKTVGIRVKRIMHAQHLKRLIPGSVVITAAGNKNEEIENERLWDKFLHREIKCVISTLLEEGTDVPSMDCIVYAGGGKSSIGSEQGLRNTRKCDMQLRTGHYIKKRGYIYLPMCQCPYLNKHSTETLKYLQNLVESHTENKIVFLNEPHSKRKIKSKV